MDPDFAEVQRYAIGKNKDKKIIGTSSTKDKPGLKEEGKVSDPYEGYSPDFEADDYAKGGGLAGLLGE